MLRVWGWGVRLTLAGAAPVGSGLRLVLCVCWRHCWSTAGACGKLLALGVGVWLCCEMNQKVVLWDRGLDDPWWYLDEFWWVLKRFVDAMIVLPSQSQPPYSKLLIMRRMVLSVLEMHGICTQDYPRKLGSWWCPRHVCSTTRRINHRAEN